MAKMGEHMKAMRDMHEKMSRANTPQERQALMGEHMKLMQEGMALMGGMWHGPRAGMPGMGGGRKGKQQPQRKKSKSGNPVKRAAEERAAAEKAQAAKTSGAGAFGSGADGAENGGMPADFDPANLPKGFEKFLGR